MATGLSPVAFSEYLWHHRCSLLHSCLWVFAWATLVSCSHSIPAPWGLPCKYYRCSKLVQHSAEHRLGVQPTSIHILINQIQRRKKQLNTDRHSFCHPGKHLPYLFLSFSWVLFVEILRKSPTRWKSSSSQETHHPDGKCYLQRWVITFRRGQEQSIYFREMTG